VLKDTATSRVRPRRREPPLQTEIRGGGVAEELGVVDVAPDGLDRGVAGGAHDGAFAGPLRAAVVAWPRRREWPAKSLMGWPRRPMWRLIRWRRPGVIGGRGRGRGGQPAGRPPLR
jgi:hypothetical protein